MDQAFGMGDPAQMNVTRNPPVVFRTPSWQTSTDDMAKDISTVLDPSVSSQAWQPNDGWPWGDGHDYDQGALLTPTPSPWSPSKEVDTSQVLPSTRSNGEKIAAIHEAQKSKRRDQNRSAQRAYRLRRETILKNLEDQVKSLEAEAKTLMSENKRLKELLRMRLSRTEETTINFPEVERRGSRGASPPTVLTNGCTLSSLQEDSDGFTLVLRIDGRGSCRPGAAPT